MDALKDDNERLRRRKDELEMLFEHSNVKEAFNIQKYKVKRQYFVISLEPINKIRKFCYSVGRSYGYESS